MHADQFPRHCAGSGNILDDKFQMHLLKTREQHLLNGLALKMHNAKQVSWSKISNMYSNMCPCVRGVRGLSFQNDVHMAADRTCTASLSQTGKTIFDAWMLEESDHVQGLAHAYGDRVVNEAFTKAVSNADPENKAVLAKLKYVRDFRALILRGIEAQCGLCRRPQVALLHQPHRRQHWMVRERGPVDAVAN